MSSFTIAVLLASFIQSSIAPDKMDKYEYIPDCRPKEGKITKSHPDRALCAEITKGTLHWICEMSKSLWRKGSCPKSSAGKGDFSDFPDFISATATDEPMEWAKKNIRGYKSETKKICGYAAYDCENGKAYKWDYVHRDFLALVAKLRSFAHDNFYCMSATELISYDYGARYWQCWIKKSEKCETLYIPMKPEVIEIVPEEEYVSGFGDKKFCYYPQYGDTPHLHTKPVSFIYHEWKASHTPLRSAAETAHSAAPVHSATPSLGSVTAVHSATHSVTPLHATAAHLEYDDFNAYGDDTQNVVFVPQSGAHKYGISWLSLWLLGIIGVLILCCLFIVISFVCCMGTGMVVSRIIGSRKFSKYNAEVNRISDDTSDV